MSARQAGIERLHELLADQATQGLAPDERAEMTALLAEHPEVDPWEFEWAAAAVDLRHVDTHEPMPDPVRTRVEARAIAWLAEQHGLSVSLPDVQVDHTPLPSSPASTAPSTTGAPRWMFAPWLVAAACIVLALFAWLPPRTSSPGTPSAEARYSDLVEVAGSTTHAWTDIERGGITGDIVWNNREQAGVMRLSGLTPNDRAKLQYQLWIFDANRGEPFNAVDGGVFDVPASGEVFVPVDAKLPVGRPTLFAITTEPPGGSVKHVSEGDYRIILTAEP